MTVGDLIAELSQIDNLNQPVKVQVKSDNARLNHIELEVDDGWEDGYSQVIIHATLNYATKD
jgi:hypothetical protein